MSEPGIPRGDYPVFCNGEEIGVVTSGTMSPSLRIGIALALVRGNTPLAVGTPLEVGIRGRRVKAAVAKTPFVTK